MKNKRISQQQKPSDNMEGNKGKMNIPNYFLILGITVLLCACCFFIGRTTAPNAGNGKDKTTLTNTTSDSTVSMPATSIKQGVYRATNDDGTVSVMAIFNDVKDGSNCAKYNHITTDKADSLTDEGLRQLTRVEDYCRWKHGRTWNYNEPQDYTGYSLRFHPFVGEYVDGTTARSALYEIEQLSDDTIIEINKRTDEKVIFNLIRKI